MFSKKLLKTVIIGIATIRDINNELMYQMFNFFVNINDLLSILRIYSALKNYLDKYSIQFSGFVSI